MARLAFTHGCFSPAILDYLTRRDNSSVEKNEVPPKCDVRTALLILLKATSRGKQDLVVDLVEQVLDIDTYEWCSSDADDFEHLRMTKKLLHYKITSTLGKVWGKEGADRKRMLLSGADSVDIKRCLTRRLHEDYVSMPAKKQKRKRDINIFWDARAGKCTVDPSISTAASSTKFRGGGSPSGRHSYEQWWLWQWCRR